MAAPFVPLTVSAIPSYLGLFFPLICLSSVVLSLVCMIRANSRWWFLALTLISMFFLPRHFAFHTNEKNKDSIDILSFNVRGGYSIVHKDAKVEKRKVNDLIRLFNHDNDIIAAQEVSQRVQNWLQDDLSYKNKISSKRKGTFIATDYEVLDQGEIDFDTKVNSCIWADIMTPHGKIRIYNVHFQSNKIKKAYSSKNGERTYG